jgi:hypothetical protein
VRGVSVVISSLLREFPLPSQFFSNNYTNRLLTSHSTLQLKSSIFWDITPCSALKVNRHFKETFRLNLQGRKICRGRNQREIKCQAELVSSSAHSSTLKMEVTCSSGKSVNFQLTTRRYISEDRTLHNHRCDNLKSYNTAVDIGSLHNLQNKWNMIRHVCATHVHSWNPSEVLFYETAQFPSTLYLMFTSLQFQDEQRGFA